MRQISIKQLKSNLCKEILDLPFEVTRYGRVIGVMAEGSHKYIDKVVTNTNKASKSTDKSIKQAKGLHNPVNAAKEQIVEIIKKKQKVVTKKTTSGTGWVNPLSNSVLAPKA